MTPEDCVERCSDETRAPHMLANGQQGDDPQLAAWWSSVLQLTGDRWVGSAWNWVPKPEPPR